MARIRSIKPDYFRNRKIRSLPYEARWLFCGIWTECDDEGRMPASTLELRGLFFADDKKATDRKVESWIQLLAQKKLIVLYVVDDARYLVVRTWKEHQRINKPQPAKYPAPPPESLFDLNSWTDSGNRSGNNSRNESGTVPVPIPRVERKGKERKGSKAVQGVATEPVSVTDHEPPPPGAEPDESTRKAMQLLSEQGKSPEAIADLLRAVPAETLLGKLARQEAV